MKTFHFGITYHKIFHYNITYDKTFQYDWILWNTSTMIQASKKDSPQRSITEYIYNK